MTDIDGRMDAWTQATRSPESASEFLKGGEPLTPHDGKGVELIKEAVRLIDPVNYKKVLETNKIPEEWNSPRFIQKLMDKRSHLEGDPDTMAYAATQAWKNKQEALEKDAENDKEIQKEVIPPMRFINEGVDENGNEWTENVTPNEIGVWRPKDVRDVPGTGFGNGGTDYRERLLNAAAGKMKKSDTTDIDGRMNAWYGANIHPEMTSKFLKAVFGDDETDAVVEDAAAEEGPDDFEAPGIKHMKDTKKERNEAIQPVVQSPDKTWGAFVTGSNSKHHPDNITSMDVNVDTASYLEDLMNKGLITEEQYREARQAFKNGRQERVYFPSL